MLSRYLNHIRYEKRYRLCIFLQQFAEVHTLLVAAAARFKIVIDNLIYRKKNAISNCCRGEETHGLGEREKLRVDHRRKHIGIVGGDCHWKNIHCDELQFVMRSVMSSLGYLFAL
mmetsp:Transcript_12460/g.15610  ORF Transcript_12460/g.15610 Transcript_12460/m.15610 type:complete len:115 (+) Transcript_12460:681-1025(+)